MRSALVPLTAALVALTPATLAAQARIGPDARTGLGLTVYDGFAQVRDTRRVPGSADAIVWTGVPDALDPGTLMLLTDGRAAAVASQRSVIDVADPASLLARSVGRQVVLVGADGERIPATIFSAHGPVFRVGTDLLVGWDGAVQLPEPPGGAEGERTIRWTLSAPVSGAVTASYLTGGISWSADYLAVLEDGGPMSLATDVSVVNRTDLALPDARLQLVAGIVRRVSGPQPPIPLDEMRLRTAEMAGVAARGTPDFDREALGDVHLYTLDRPVTLIPGEATRVALYPTARVPVEREYVFRGNQMWFRERHPEAAPLQHAEVWLTFDNEGAAGLGEPLPAGIVHVYRRDPRGVLQFSGDAPIPHTPSGETVRLMVGRAFDVVAERRQTEFRRVAERVHEVAVRIEVRNRGADARTVTFYEPLHGDWEILQESRPHERIDANTVKWTLTVPPGGQAVLEYRARIAF